MNDAGPVSRRQTISDLHCDLNRFAHRNRAGSDQLAQCLTFNQLGHDPTGVFLPANVVDRNDFGMVQGRGRPRFALETL